MKKVGWTIVFGHNPTISKHVDNLLLLWVPGNPPRTKIASNASVEQCSQYISRLLIGVIQMTPPRLCPKEIWLMRGSYSKEAVYGGWSIVLSLK
jgi:hypothetical protein